MILVHQMSDEELVILWHRFNLSITTTEYQTEEWRQKYYDDEYSIGWVIYTAVTKELKKREVDPQTYFDEDPEPDIEIGKKKVEFAEDGTSIGIGCEEISYDTIHKIYTTIVDKRNQYVESQE